MVTKTWGRRKWELVFHGYEISVWDGENVLERDSGNGCTTMGMYFNASELYTYI